MEDALTAARDDSSTTSRRGRGLGAVWAAVGVSTFGDGAFAAALPLAAAAVTRDPTAVAAVSAAAIIPWVLVQPVAGALMDRWPHRSVMLIADIIRAVIVAAVAVLVATGDAGIAVLSAAGCAVVVGQIFHDTAVQGVIPTLAGRTGTQLDRANGRVYGAETAGKQLLGPPAGSASFTIANWLPFAADAASFVASAALLWRLPRARAPRQAGGPLCRAVVEGAMWLVRHRQLRTLALLASAGNIAYHLSWATFVLLATDPAELGLTPAAFGFMFAAYALGGVVGGPLTARVNAAVGPHRALLCLALVHAVAWPLIAATGTVWVAVPALALVGAAQTMTTTTNVTLRQMLVPTELLNRVIAAFRWIVNAPTPLAALAGGFLAATCGLRAPLIVAGLVLAGAALAASPTLLRTGR
jgi:MFS family permease